MPAYFNPDPDVAINHPSLNVHAYTRAVAGITPANPTWTISGTTITPNTPWAATIPGGDGPLWIGVGFASWDGEAYAISDATIDVTLLDTAHTQYTTDRDAAIVVSTNTIPSAEVYYLRYQLPDGTWSPWIQVGGEEDVPEWRILFAPVIRSWTSSPHARGVENTDIREVSEIMYVWRALEMDDEQRWAGSLIDNRPNLLSPRAARPTGDDLDNTERDEVVRVEIQKTAASRISHTRSEPDNSVSGQTFGFRAYLLRTSPSGTDDDDPFIFNLINIHPQVNADESVYGELAAYWR